MKIKTLHAAIYLIFSALPTVTFSQWYTDINVNHVKATLRSDGALFFDGATGQFIAPYANDFPFYY